jgi:predicted phosphohydrolase
MEKKMSVFAIGDTHLSFSTDKPMDIFKGWFSHTEKLRENWERAVSDNDTVVIPGDISWAMKLEESEKDFAFLHSLPGEKIILKGNHDYWWTTKAKMDAFLNKNGFDSIKILHNNAYKVGDYAICGTRGWFFDDIQPESEKVILREAGRLRTSLEHGLKLGGELLVFLHYPPLNANEKCEEIYNVLMEYPVKRCFYGHIHAENIARYAHFNKDGIDFTLVSSDHLKFCPLLIESF